MTNSLQLAHQLKERDVLLVGGGEVALTRVLKLIKTGARVTLVSAEIHPTITKKFGFEGVKNNNWTPESLELYQVVQSPFLDEHFKLCGEGKGWSIILTAIPDQEESERIYHEAKRLFGPQQMVNVADNPPLCDFHFGANLEVHGLQLLISSNGSSPRFTALVRDEIKRHLDTLDLERAVETLGQLRALVREASPDQQQSKYRMQWVKQCTDIFGIEHAGNIDTQKLLTLYTTMNSSKSLKFPPKETLLQEYLIE
ncbi:bifunctional precorrin-2 dehydrogenase/sirohydrochlorin ferrochelatase MET8 [Nakaseomyces bracarensis]|uniref:bifunctional precorrin-2 dehydrogenase/sirohydrochlorin ferrochelatase MET8 n=1 Tax=Nakaseomyces bracarensis TaxID=273131 RepID=UPI00387114FF